VWLTDVGERAPVNVEFDVARLWLDADEVPVCWARLCLRREALRAGRPSRASWAIAATLDKPAFYTAAQCRIRAVLHTGETLEGCAVLDESGGCGIWLTSDGPWTGVTGW
jgi:hypothetical protein